MRLFYPSRLLITLPRPTSVPHRRWDWRALFETVVNQWLRRYKPTSHQLLSLRDSELNSWENSITFQNQLFFFSPPPPLSLSFPPSFYLNQQHISALTGSLITFAIYGALTICYWFLHYLEHDKVIRVSVERREPLPRLGTCRDIVFIKESPAVFKIIETTCHCAAGERISLKLLHFGRVYKQDTVELLNKYIISLLLLTALSMNNQFIALKPEISAVILIFFSEVSELQCIVYTLKWLFT